MRELYCIADVYLNPTMQDNYPSVNLEAAACNTPIITYRTGGSPECSFCPSCVVDKGDYYISLKRIILENRYQQALKLEEREYLGKQRMVTLYIDLYGNKK